MSKSANLMISPKESERAMQIFGGGCSSVAEAARFFVDQ
jgi:hypothetical protein